MQNESLNPLPQIFAKGSFNSPPAPGRASLNDPPGVGVGVSSNTGILRLAENRPPSLNGFPIMKLVEFARGPGPTDRKIQSTKEPKEFQAESLSFEENFRGFAAMVQQICG